MKTSTRYQCEFCGTEYSDKNKCKQCEENHKTNLKIIGKNMSHSKEIILDILQELKWSLRMENL